MSYARRAAARRAYGREDAFATTLFAIMLDLFGDAGFVNWDPDTIAIEFAAATGMAWDAAAPVCRDKLMMMTGVHAGDGFFRRLEVFIPTCNAFGGSEVDQRLFDPATVDEMAWAVTEVRFAGYDEAFHPEIAAYAGVQAGLEGFETMPPTLSWGDPPKAAARREAAAAGGAELFAAAYRANRDDIAAVEAGVRRKAGLLVAELNEFPFASREPE